MTDRRVREGRDRLIADGRLIPASKPLRLPRRAVVDRASQEVLDDIREDR